MKFFLALILALPLQAQAITGNELYTMFTSNDNDDLAMGIGYLQALDDGLFINSVIEKDAAAKQGRLVNNFIMVCRPAGATFEQMRDVLISHLKDNPSERHLNGYVISMVALRKAWPCSE